MSTCGNCGSTIQEGTAFCPKCGSQTGDTNAATVALTSMPDVDPLLRQLKEELAEDYEVENELGRGGMAIVFKGKEQMLERVVAIKVLPPEMANTGDTAERFKREARLAASLDHQNIIPVYRVGQTKGGLFYMAMKFVEGMALDSIMESQGALPLSVIMRLLEASASALAFAHDKGIIHRDIKGGNILIDSDGRVMVADFGIARAVADTSLTKSGMVVGTPNYMSPEQCGGGKLGPQSDQYSLGVLAFQMLTGQLPFDADSIMGVIQHHYLTPVPSVQDVRPGVPDPLLDIVYQLMEKKAENRYAKTSDVVEALAAVPETPAEKRESALILQELAKGVKLDMVRTASLPPIKVPEPTADAPKGLKRASERLAGKPKRSKLPLALAAFVVVAGGAGAAYQFGFRQTSAPAQPTQDSLSAPPAATGGLAVFTGLPDDATISIGGRVYTERTIPLAEGTYEYTVRAAGYQPFTATFSVAVGQDVPIQPALVAVQRQPSRPVSQPTTTPAQPVGTAFIGVSVSPLQAQIFLDGEQIGTGRFARREIPAGRHTLRVMLTGYVTYDTTFTIEPNAVETFTGITLQPQGGSP